MMRFFILLATLLFLQSCEKKPVSIPADVISRDSMIVILTEMHLAEAELQLKNLAQSDSTKRIAFGYYKAVFNKHKISKEAFDRSFRYYVKQPEIMTAMYDSIITRLSAQNLPQVRK